MEQICSMGRLRSFLFPGLLVLASGCAAAQTPPGQTATSQPAAVASKPMEGCGMMIDGKMVYKNVTQGDCMKMVKPGNMMPNGVTMHSDPGGTPAQTR